MKNIIGGFTMAVLVVCLALPNLVFAGAEGDTASGSFKFLLEDGNVKAATRINRIKAGDEGGCLTLVVQSRYKRAIQTAQVRSLPNE